MTFNFQIPTPFNLQDIESFDRYALGVYGIFRNDICIYVDRGNIHNEL